MVSHKGHAPHFSGYSFFLGCNGVTGSAVPKVMGCLWHNSVWCYCSELRLVHTYNVLYVYVYSMLLHLCVQFLPREALMARADSLKKATQSLIDQATDGEWAMDLVRSLHCVLLMNRGGKLHI